MFGRSILAGAALVSLASAASASTVQHTYNFACPNTSCSYSVIKNFDPVGPDTVPALQVTSKTVSTDGNTLSNITPASGVGIGQWKPYGLGMMSSSNDNSHTVDGSGLNDLLELVFDTEVRIVSATFAYAGVITNSNDGFAFFADDDHNGSIAGDMVFSHEDIGATNGVGTYNFTTNALSLDDVYSKVFAFAAIWDVNQQVCNRWRYGVCTRYTTINLFDSFKLQSIVVEEREPPPPPSVPLPAALPMLLSVLGAGGLFARLKSRAS